MTTGSDGSPDPFWQKQAEGDVPSVPESPYPPLPGGGAPLPPYPTQSYGNPPSYESAPQYAAPQSYGYQQPYGQAPGGYPVPPAAPYGGYPPALTPTSTNGLAISSLVASCLGIFYGITAIVGIILGIVALSQIKQTGQQGRGLAIAGIAVGGAFVALFLLFFLVVVGIAVSSY